MAIDADLKAAFDDLLRGCETLQLATLSAHHEAEASYAPYIYHAGSYYIFVSQLASHTRNLLHSASASLMLIESEAEARNPFARKRFTAQCQVREIPPGDSVYAGLLDQMEARFGSTLGVLRSLPDFHLFALQPQQGRLVIGFGKAFELDAQQLLELAG